MSLWMAFLFVPSCLMIFFKSGAFSFDGVITMYTPTCAFFTFVMTTSACMIRSLRAGAVEEHRAAETRQSPATAAV